MLALLMTMLIIADDPMGDLKDMQGTWVLVSTTDGLPEEKQTKPTDRSFKLVVEGDTTRGVQGDRAGTRGTFTLDSTKIPKRIDSFHPEAGHLKGIYEMHGDTMRTCFSPPGQERPTSFTEARTTIAVYERERTRP
jgi:uncharacterized protein (TIGR03067 family)